MVRSPRNTMARPFSTINTPTLPSPAWSCASSSPVFLSQPGKASSTAEKTISIASGTNAVRNLYPCFIHTPIHIDDAGIPTEMV